jgi:hypothetical protein
LLLLLLLLLLKPPMSAVGHGRSAAFGSSDGSVWGSDSRRGRKQMKIMGIPLDIVGMGIIEEKMGFNGL